MKPAIPVIPQLPELTGPAYAEGQPQYIPLPSLRTPDGTVTTRWAMSWKERLRILFSGHIWLTILTFNEPLQPVRLDTKVPTEYSELVEARKSVPIGTPWR